MSLFILSTRYELWGREERRVTGSQRGGGWEVRDEGCSVSLGTGAMYVSMYVSMYDTAGGWD